ncbi:hypothetical protein PLICRDRAFT_543894 [Plicaturopsis crispa FD-325 SS-3]|nr:hypothetical protein PLICRDRAFT_543894 [Plicaturopsis crispa FD-325 SS-3]
MSPSAFWILSALVAGVVNAAPSSFIRRQDTVSTLSSSQLSAFAPYTQFARAAYCSSDKLQGWKCGEACDATPGFNVTLTGGDGDAVQLFYVGHWPDQDSIVVAHQGTDPLKLQSDLTDLTAELSDFNSTLFPGLPSGVQGHQGFLEEHEKTADVILAEVKSLLASTGAKSVTLIGHSLGGALAELDHLFLKLNLPSDISLSGVTYGLPRVGNPDFVTFFDQQASNFTRVNNMKDLVPILPGRFLGYEHPQGETHILGSGQAVACPGNDDATDDDCQIKTVPNVFDGNVIDHLGPYDGIFIGTPFCF